MKHYLIDGSKQIIADVTLMPKEILKPKCEDFWGMKVIKWMNSDEKENEENF